MRVMVTGAEGQLGGELIRQLGADGLPYRWDELDITDQRLVEQTIAETRPDAVINCAAFTNVDRAEEEADLCFDANAHAVAYLADACQRIQAPLVQISTDYVFGEEMARRTPYLESDPPAPRNVYGRSKLAGEQNAARCAQHIIVRTCGLYGESSLGNNFVDKMLQLAEKHSSLRVVHDQVGTPTYAPHLARAVLFLLERRGYGTFHVVNGGSTTWFDFAVEIFRLAERSVEVEPISAEQYAAPAPRAEYSVLDTTKYHALGGPPMPPWRSALHDYIRSKA